MQDQVQNQEAQVEDETSVDETVDGAVQIAGGAEGASSAGEVEIPDMPYDQLEQVNEAVIRKLREAREKAKDTDINTVKVLVAKHGLKWADIKPAGGTGKASTGSVAPKYRDPETGQTWTGRGRSPLWIRDKNKEDFLIQK